MSLIQTADSAELRAGYDDVVAKNYNFAALYQGYKAPSVLLKAVRNYLQPGMQVLEGGVGTGLFARRLWRLGVEVYGMDISSDMLERCWSRRIWNRPLRANIKSFGLLGLFKREEICKALIKADMENEPWPIPSSRMDGVVVCGSMEWIDNPRNMVAEASRVLNDGGFFGITFVPEQAGKKLPGRHSTSSMLDLMRENGIMIVHNQPFTENFANNGANTVAKHRVLVGIKAREAMQAVA